MFGATNRSRRTLTREQMRQRGLNLIILPGFVLLAYMTWVWATPSLPHGKFETVEGALATALLLLGSLSAVVAGTIYFLASVIPFGHSHPAEDLSDRIDALKRDGGRE